MVRKITILLGAATAALSALWAAGGLYLLTGFRTGAAQMSVSVGGVRATIPFVALPRSVSISIIAVSSVAFCVLIWRFFRAPAQTPPACGALQSRRSHRV
jgi:hypothetical protein